MVNFLVAVLASGGFGLSVYAIGNAVSEGFR